MWKIIATSSGVHRWQKIANMHSKTIKKSKRVDYKDKDNNMQKSSLSKNVNISTNELVKIGKKNKVVTSGASKSALALPSKEKREVKKMIIKQHDNPVTDYKGMWKPAPKPLNKMTRSEMIHSLRGFRDAWEREMGRNQDLSDERLAAETEKNLREHLTWYYSDMAKNQAANWIRYNK
jgi:hypothetical protein